MNKTIVLVTIGILLLIGGAVSYVLLKPASAPVAVTSESADDNKKDSPDAATQPTQQPGVYTEYSDGSLAAAKGTRLLFFHAPWCPQCREIETSIEQDGVPDNVTVLKVDYDSNQTLRQKYGVTLQTTFVKIDENGNKIDSYTAYEEPHFDAVKRELLQ